MTFLPPGVDGLTAALLIAVSFLTSALTAAFGIGGGVAMLGALAGTVPPNVIVAVHGVVQLGSNLGRAILQRRHANWPLVRQFVIGAGIGVAFGALIFTSVPERALLALMGLFILMMVWVPKPRIPGLERTGMLVGGAISSVLTMFVGATGPFIQAVLMQYRLDRRGIIANQAVMMTIQHGLKVIAFTAIGIALVPWLPLIAAMIVAGFVGTVLGTRLLNRMSEALFQAVLKALLTLIALDLLRRAAGIRLPGL
ncbi:sulfite exporter TauE/SafE family protein [Rhabdaerophilum calidifontis]|uniref:sulfite exporter TauE/SafE family protein n=1 Tax=Rhabdaerophilum calidifontis TaxID=2604328 RepID=UPI001238D48A|nr:sulfite exporter TauE/SafE family protein [Rhabdaerophilum calidifontis]